MFGKLSKKLTNALISQGTVDAGERALYEYGFFLLLSNVFFGAVVLLTGFMLNILPASIFFYAAFRALREYAGGYHAQTETRCLLISCTAILGSLFIIKGIQATNLLWISCIPAVFGTIAIALFAPLDTSERPLSEAEQKQFRKRSIALLTAADILFAVGSAFQWAVLFVPVGTAIGLEGLLITLGKIKRVRRQKHTK